MKEPDYELLRDIRLVNMKQYYKDYFGLLALPEHEETLGSLLEPVIEGAAEALEHDFDTYNVGVGFNIDMYGVQTPPHCFNFEIYADNAHNLTIVYAGCQTEFPEGSDDE